MQVKSEAKNFGSGIVVVFAAVTITVSVQHDDCIDMLG